MRTIAVRMGLLLSVALLVGAAFVLAEEKEESQRSVAAYPKIADLLSKDKAVRSEAIQQFDSAQRELSERLVEIVHPDTGKDLDRELRGNACFLLARIRTMGQGRQAIIEALIAAIDENFLGPLVISYHSGILNPPDVLVAIGKPAVEPVLDELANTEEEKGDRLVLLRNVLYGIEGADCALLRIQTRMDKEPDPEKKARLKATLEWLEGHKASRLKK